MKRAIKYFTRSMSMAVTLLFLPLGAMASPYNLQGTTMSTLKDNLIGGWEYTVDNAPEGYGSGLMMIVMQDNAYKVQVQTGAGVMNATNVVVKGNDIAFTLNVEGENVTVALSAKGSTISGTSTSSAGVFKINGVKSLSVE